jgi:glucuronosyltransferase
MKRVSRIFKDRPQDPLNTAIYWIEYVIRNGRNSLRSDSMDLTWWQISLLDIIVVTCGVIFISLLVIILLIKKLFYMLCWSNRNIIYNEKKYK